MSASNGVLLPHNKQAEQTVLGALLRDNNLLAVVQELLQLEDFYTHGHRLIYQAIIDLISQEGKPAEPTLVADHLSGRKQLEDAGGYHYFAELWSAAPSAGNIEHYCKIVHERSLQRQVYRLSQEMQELSMQPGMRPDELLEKSRERLLLIATQGDGRQRAAAGDDGELKWQPFPVDKLPTVLKDFIEYAAESIMVDAGMLVLPVLCSVAGVIGNRWEAVIKRDWKEPCILWGMVVAKSSQKKTPCFNAATSPIADMQRTMHREYQANMEAYCEANDVYALAKKEATTAEARKDLGKPPVKPVKERILVDNITVETLIGLMSDNPAGLLLAMDELSGFFGSFMKYRQASSGSDQPQWLRMYNGNWISYDRKSGDRKEIFVDHACISIVGTIQPTILAGQFTKEAYHSGLAARFLLMFPPSSARVYSDKEIPAGVTQAYAQLVKDLHDSYLDSINRPDWQRRGVDLTAEAKAKWIEFYNEWGQVQHQADGEEEYALAKLEGYTARLALLLAVVDATVAKTNPVIEVTHVDRAIAMVRWFARETARVYEVLRNGGEEKEEDQVLAWVRSQGGKVTVRDLVRSKMGRSQGTEWCRARLDALVREGVAKWVTKPSTEAGGRPSTSLVLLDFILPGQN